MSNRDRAPIVGCSIEWVHRGRRQVPWARASAEQDAPREKYHAQFLLASTRLDWARYTQKEEISNGHAYT